MEILTQVLLWIKGWWSSWERGGGGVLLLAGHFHSFSEPSCHYSKGCVSLNAQNVQVSSSVPLSFSPSPAKHLQMQLSREMLLKEQLGLNFSCVTLGNHLTSLGLSFLTYKTAYQHLSQKIVLKIKRGNLFKLLLSTLQGKGSVCGSVQLFLILITLLMVR